MRWLAGAGIERNWSAHSASVAERANSADRFSQLPYQQLFGIQWGLEAIKTGVFSPLALVGPVPFAYLQTMIRKAHTALETLTPEEVNGRAGKD